MTKKDDIKFDVCHDKYDNRIVYYVLVHGELATGEYVFEKHCSCSTEEEAAKKVGSVKHR